VCFNKPLVRATGVITYALLPVLYNALGLSAANYSSGSPIHGNLQRCTGEHSYRSLIPMLPLHIPDHVWPGVEDCGFGGIDLVHFGRG
jgi:hypothetical protein